MAVGIRRAVVGDEGHLARLAQMAHDLHVEQRPDQFRSSTREDLTAWYRGQLQTPSIAAWLAEADEHPVGYLLADAKERSANQFVQARRWYEVDQLAVDPAWRRRGIARALIDALLGHASELGLTEIELTVWDFNGPARRCFERLGFGARTHRLERRTP